MDRERDTPAARRRPDLPSGGRVADEWWDALVSDRTPSATIGFGAGSPKEPFASGAGAAAAAALVDRAPRRVRDGARQAHGRASSALGTAAATVGVRMARSSRFRRIVLGAVVLAVLLVGTTLSVGVIVLNNRVIERSAELGRLDRTRRDLRTDNALMAAEIARLSAPPRIVALAEKRLDMRPSVAMTQYIYLDDADRPRPPRRIDITVARGLRAIAIVAAHRPLPAAYSMAPTTPVAVRPAAGSAASTQSAGQLARTDPAIAGSGSAAAATAAAAAAGSGEVAP